MHTTAARSRARRTVFGIALAAMAVSTAIAPATARDGQGGRLPVRATSGSFLYETTFRGASRDGTKVFFTSFSRLAAQDTDGLQDVYVRSGGTTTLISTGPTGGNGQYYSWFEAASSDGTMIWFTTDERLVAADTDSEDDIYLRSDGATGLVSKGAVNGNGPFGTLFGGVSDDGSRVYFSTEEALVASDTDRSMDIYRRAGGVTTRVSGPPANDGNPWHDVSFFEAESPDGARVLFRSTDHMVAGDTDSESDLYERSGGVTRLVTSGPVGGNGPFEASLVGTSDDRSRVMFATAEPLVAADRDSNVDIYQRSGGVTTLVSQGAMNGNGDFDVYPRGIAGDLAKVFFNTAEALVTADTDSSFDAYERSGGHTTLVSSGAVYGSGGGHAGFAGTSNGGATVYFTTSDRLVAADRDSRSDVYQRSAGTTTLVSTGALDPERSSWYRGSSSDGSRVFFESIVRLAPGDTDSADDIFERSGGTTRLVSAGAVNGNGPFHVEFSGCSIDGSRVWFLTVERLVPGDTDDTVDLYERSGGVTKLVSRGP